MHIETFQQHFEAIDDPRQSAKVTYPIFDVLFVTLCAVIAGARGWFDIREYADGHHDWFKEHGLLLNGVPVDDTFARIISRIKPELFQQCFISWMQEVHQLTDGELIAIDGKVLRSSYDRADKASTIHMVSAYAAANSLVLGQVKTDQKSNEITAIPKLLEVLDIKGALVSIDAMGCYTDIAETITQQGGDYLLALKNNQGSLAKAVRQAFKPVRTQALTQEQVEMEQQHGRIEARAYSVLDASQLDGDFSKWPGLKTVGLAIAYRQERGKEPGLEHRYYISSAELSEQKLAEAVRGHWSIENSLHWVLDVTMREDDCPIYVENAATNLASLRHMALNMLRAEKSKVSIAAKQKRCWMKTERLEAVLEAGLPGLFKS